MGRFFSVRLHVVQQDSMRGFTAGAVVERSVAIFSPSLLPFQESWQECLPFYKAASRSLKKHPRTPRSFFPPPPRESRPLWTPVVNAKLNTNPSRVFAPPRGGVCFSQQLGRFCTLQYQSISGTPSASPRQTLCHSAIQVCFAFERVSKTPSRGGPRICGAFLFSAPQVSESRKYQGRQLQALASHSSTGEFGAGKTRAAEGPLGKEASRVSRGTRSNF